MEQAVELTSVPTKPNTFTNVIPPWSFPGSFGVFGGTTLAHCLMAAQKSISKNYVAHSLHCSFLSRADPSLQIEYQVENTRDGKSFATRTVRAIQKESLIAVAIVSFVAVGITAADATAFRGTNSFEHSHKIPQGLIPPEKASIEGEGIPGPLEVRGGQSLNRGFDSCVLCVCFTDESAISGISPNPVHSLIRYWIRAKRPILKHNLHVHLAALAWMSDAYFIAAAVHAYDELSRRSDKEIAKVASLSHVIYFHQPDAVRADEWMCSERESSWAGNDRAFVAQRIWNREGVLVATCVQEGLLRIREPAAKSKL
ncbi:thioesterase-like superfamily-domain-containing protein [Penicillium diatomitis]|uniref:Thioesterase-like superfamily-domain-containing protein n=1 Tax=Penicillium diatomitis TaxID=2819901 RepID=A0A9W9WKX0_9EURO|nr:thioesterase-like superfamily-domain-containing protein [Penicillium diatomitis]KAJ5469366.1 thioesterase-like superfamily-domain-containing protein [Penicillium diatomitis]